MGAGRQRRVPKACRLGTHLLNQFQVLWRTHLPNGFQHLRSRIHVTRPLKQPRLLSLPPARRRPSRQTPLLHRHTPLIDLCQPRGLLQHDRDTWIRWQWDGTPHDDTTDRLRVCVVEDRRTRVRRRGFTCKCGDRRQCVRCAIVDCLHAGVNRERAFQYLWQLGVLVEMLYVCVSIQGSVHQMDVEVGDH